MRIAIVTNNFPAPSETFISNKVLLLAARGHHVIVFCSSFNAAAWQTINTGSYAITIQLVNRKALAQYVLLHPALWAAVANKASSKAQSIASKLFISKVNKLNPGIIHFEFSGLALHYFDILKKLAAKTVVSCRGSAEKVKLPADKERQEKTRQLFSAVDAIHCVSGDMRQTILPYCAMPEKIFINYPSIDAGIFNRNTAYASHSPVNILSIGRLTFQKGYLTGLLAVQLLKKAGIAFSWTIVGDGQQKEELIFHINQLGLQKQVALAGARSRNEVIALYNQCDIFFLPSVYEGIANVALEAMSMELPVVATRSGGMDEVITHEVNGMLADVYDSETLAKHLLRLANDNILCNVLGKNARKRVLEKFTLDMQIEKFEKIYAGLLSN